MKKIFSIFLIFVLTFSIIGCSDEKTKKDNTIGRIVDVESFEKEIQKQINLKDYNLEVGDYTHNQTYNYTSKEEKFIKNSKDNFKISVDGIEFYLPITLEEFVSLGFKLSHSNGTPFAENDMNTEDRNGFFTVTTPKGNTFDIYCISKDNKPTAYKNLIVIQFNCGFYKGTLKYGVGERNNAPKIKLFKNLTQKATVSEIVTLLGSPNKFNFGVVQNKDGKNSLSHIQFNYQFKNEKYSGSIEISCSEILDTKIERTDFITNFSYRIDPESFNE